MKRAATVAVLLATPLALGCPRVGGDPGTLDAPSGRVTFEVAGSPTSGQPPAFAVTACFWSGGTPALDGGPRAPCRGSTVGSCCVSGDDPGLDRQGCIDENVDVGPVQLLVNGAALGTVALASGRYALQPGAALAWKPGDRLEVRGGTNGFPAFDVTVAAASAPSLSQPSLGVGGALSFSRDQSLLFAWRPAAGAAGSEAWVSVTEPQTGALESVDCLSEGDPGQAVFSGAVLGSLPVGLGTAEVARESRALAGAIEIVSRGETEIAVQTQ
ncbi:MAG: hypothetical protein ACYDCL_23080 [Myxococcales bacterium]